MNYKTIKLGNNATLRVAVSKIIATITSAESDRVTMYIDGMSRPLELSIEGKSADNINNYIFKED